MPDKAHEFALMKSDDDKRLVFGWASVSITEYGEQIEDRQKDIIDPEDLEEAAYEYVLNFRDGGEEHIPTLRKKARLVESCVFTEEKQKAMGIPSGTIPIGWWIGFYVDDDSAWEKIKNGTYRMFSIEGKANRLPIDKSVEPKGCGVLVVRNGKVLTGTRIERESLGQICGPGGHIEEGESPEEAARREAYEEFGIRCGYLKPLGTIQDGSSAVFLCREFDGEPETDEDEMTNLRWMDPKKITEDGTFPPFYQSLALLPNNSVAKTFDEILNYNPYHESTSARTFDEILKFNPFHDAAGKFSSSNGFKTYSANPKTKAGAMAISRSAQAGHGTTFNSHKESQGENIDQNYNWLNGGPGAKQLSAQGQLASQQPQKPVKNYDKLGFADYDDADYHQLYNGRQYYQQQNLTPAQKQAVDNYLEADTEGWSLYSHSQNLNYMMASGQQLTGKYQQTHDGLMSSMHNIGYNVELTRYDHAGMINGMLQALGAGNDYEHMSAASIKKALVGQTVNEDKFLSTSYNGFKNAPQSSKQVFDTRAVKINYKVKADVQAMMPGIGPGGDLGEIIIAPTNGTANRAGKITDVRLTGQMVRRKGTQTYNQPRIEIDIEI